MNFVIYGPARTKKNSARIFRNQRTGVPFIAPSRQAGDWTKNAVEQLRGQLSSNPLAIDLNCAAVIYRDRRVGDLINYLQAVCDALEDAGVVEDDKWIVQFDGSRMAHDKENPRVEIVLTETTKECK